MELSAFVKFTNPKTGEYLYQEVKAPEECWDNAVIQCAKEFAFVREIPANTVRLDLLPLEAAPCRK